ncbi:DUF4114 domain-containing protein [Roseateles terrae]|uniref:DUF4114 domain-containing protein n=1 Tax=Roseateles terrae TaxID=431060 RepID=A0ABR6GQD5_9BURK|nr:DUF4114 domain-containing protein [Roseateles terrae]MBB3194321.1 hypothetical protein [Roseateles terrae]OWQ88159.1 hypothetical protein CDN98_08480 [Roseateles terrae]
MNLFHLNFNPWAGGAFGPVSGFSGGPGGFQPPFGFGGGLANAWMNHTAHGMSHGWGAWGGHGSHGSHGGHGGWGHHGMMGPQGHGNHGGGWGMSPWGQVRPVPSKGEWSAENGGFTVGRSGQLDVQIGHSDAQFKNNLQFRVDGGPWQSIGHSKNEGKKVSIHADPGANVQFRIQTPEGNTFRAGTTRNSDGLDHGKVTQSGRGYKLGFEDLKGGGDGDFNDAVISVRDPGRWG